jgi:hypothetical protein
MGAVFVLDRLREGQDGAFGQDRGGDVGPSLADTCEHRRHGRLVLAAPAIDRRGQRQSLPAQCQHLEHRLDVAAGVAAMAAGQTGRIREAVTGLPHPQRPGRQPGPLSQLRGAQLSVCDDDDKGTIQLVALFQTLG